MIDPKPADRPASTPDPVGASTSSAFSPFWSGLIAGIVGGLLVGTLMNVWSSYLTRLDQHVQEAEKCKSLVSSLLTTTSLIHDVAQSAAASIAATVPANIASNKFALPPLDEILHSQDQSLDILDQKSRDSILPVEAYYRALRDDLSNTPGVYHTGETFGVPPVFR